VISPFPLLPEGPFLVPPRPSREKFLFFLTFVLLQVIVVNLVERSRIFFSSSQESVDFRMKLAFSTLFSPLFPPAQFQNLTVVSGCCRFYSLKWHTFFLLFPPSESANPSPPSVSQSFAFMWDSLLCVYKITPLEMYRKNFPFPRDPK